MFASSSHEFRTPIGSGLNGLELMEPWVAPEGRRHFTVVKSSLQFLLMLANNTLDYAQLESGNFRMNCQDTTLRDEVSEVISLIGVIISFKQAVVLSYDIPEEVPAVIEMDGQRLKQILINLLKNATKFTFKGFIMLRLKCVKLLATKDRKPVGYQDAIAFEVYDTGIGINEAHIQNLFQLFGKLKQQDAQINKEGIGLGLYIVRQMAEQLGGNINADSVEG